MERVNLTEVQTIDPILGFKSNTGGNATRLHMVHGPGRGQSGNCRELYAYTHPLLGRMVHAKSTRDVVVEIPWHIVRQCLIAGEAAAPAKRTRKTKAA